MLDIFQGYPPGHTKGVLLRIITPQEGSQDLIHGQPSSEHGERPVESLKD